MIALDTNVLVYAHRKDSPHHEPCRTAIQKLVEGRESWTLPWPCIAEFVAVVTSPKQFSPPSTVRQAARQIRAWRDAPNCGVLTETGRTEGTFFDLLVDSAVVGPRVYDARIAAICLDHGVSEFWTADRDYSRFPKLRTRNPLIEGLA